MKRKKMTTKKTNKVKIIYIILFLLLSSCGQDYKVIEIANLNKMKEISLYCTEDIDYVSGIELMIAGFTDGNIIIEQTNKSNVIYTYRIDSGNINEDFSGDWYAKECFLRILPENADSVYLKIKYRFY